MDLWVQWSKCLRPLMMHKLWVLISKLFSWFTIFFFSSRHMYFLKQAARLSLVLILLNTGTENYVGFSPLHTTKVVAWMGGGINCFEERARREEGEVGKGLREEEILECGIEMWMWVLQRCKLGKNLKCSSNFNVHTNQLWILLKCRFWFFSSRFPGKVGPQSPLWVVRS